MRCLDRPSVAAGLYFVPISCVTGWEQISTDPIKSAPHGHAAPVSCQSCATTKTLYSKVLLAQLKETARRLRARECGVDCSPVRQQPDAFPPQWRWNFALCVTESICHALSSAFLDVATVLAAFGRQLTYSGPVVRVVGAVLVARGLLPQLATAYLIGEKLWGEWYVLRAWPHEWPHSPTAPTPPHPASTRRPPGGWVVPQVQTTLDVSSNATRIAGEPTADITIHRSTKERT